MLLILVRLAGSDVVFFLTLLSFFNSVLIRLHHLLEDICGGFHVVLLLITANQILDFNAL